MCVPRVKKKYKVEVNLGGGESFLSVNKEIFRQASLLDLDDDLMYEVQALYEEARKNGLTKYKQEEKIITALIYVICRKRTIPLTLHKICDVLRTDYRSINKVYRYIIKRMAMHIPPTTAKEYAQKFGVELRLSNRTIKKAERIIDLVKNMGTISGKGPAGVAAASISLASDLERLETSQKEIAEISGVTQVTIRNRYKEIEECLGAKISRI